MPSSLSVHSLDVQNLPALVQTNTDLVGDDGLLLLVHVGNSLRRTDASTGTSRAARLVYSLWDPTLVLFSVLFLTRSSYCILKESANFVTFLG